MPDACTRRRRKTVKPANETVNLRPVSHLLNRSTLGGGSAKFRSTSIAVDEIHSLGFTVSSSASQSRSAPLGYLTMRLV